jgi:hypothetical protein
MYASCCRLEIVICLHAHFWDVVDVCWKVD